VFAVDLDFPQIEPLKKSRQGNVVLGCGKKLAILLRSQNHSGLPASSFQRPVPVVSGEDLPDFFVGARKEFRMAPGSNVDLTI
jgi:hypothetical protein